MTNLAMSQGAVFRPGTSDAEIEAAAAKAVRMRKAAVLFWRWAILLVFLGGWEMAARTAVIDEFFFSKPSAIYGRLA